MKKAKGIFAEFKDFITRGNVIDLAVGVLIGAAFQAIVNSLVNDIISPLLGIFGKMDFSKHSFDVGEAQIKYGAFITAVINFLIMAFIIFWIVKFISKLKNIKITKEDEVIKAPTVKKCPYCITEIAIEATRCPHCTSELEE